MLVRGASCICLEAPKRKKSTSRWPILGLVLATREDVPCNMLADGGANKSDGWGLGRSAAEWHILPAGGELIRPKAGTRIVLRRAVSSTRTWKVSSVWCVPSDQQEGPKTGTRRVLRRAVSSARTWKVPSVWYMSGDQQEGPLPSHCCCGCRCKRKGAPSIEKPPEKEQGLWARWEAKQNRYEKRNTTNWKNTARKASPAVDATCKVIGGIQSSPSPAGVPFEQVLGDYSLYFPS